ncbi:MAG: M23 family metallopeptidase [Bacillota bacterium]|nr:M23 family metallopeptidase [Bacillota bacterium]
MDEQQGPNPGKTGEAGGPSPWWPPRWSRSLGALLAAPARRLIALGLLVFVVAFGAYYAVLAHPSIWRGLGTELRRVELAGNAALHRLRSPARPGGPAATSPARGRGVAQPPAQASTPGTRARTGTEGASSGVAGGAGGGAGTAGGPAAAAAQQGTASATGQAAQEAAAQPAGAANPAQRKLLWPVSGPVIAGFGWGYSVTMHDWRWHDGIDIAAKVGTPVRAAAAGRVSAVSGDDQDGWTVRIAHVANVQTVYGGLERPLVKPGQAVEKGQLLGDLGGGPLDEAAEAPHLHFAILASGEATDPINFLPPLP